MPNNSKYTTWYNQLIDNARIRQLVGYCEKHHIQPKSLGGSNDPVNIVKLTAREHYLAHLLLTKMFRDTNSTFKMICAALRVGHNPSNGITGGRNYEAAKAKHREMMSERMKGNQNKKGVKESDETRAKKVAAFAASTTHASHLKTIRNDPEYMIRWIAGRSKNKDGARGQRNAMSRPECRARLSASKVGKRMFVDSNGIRKLYTPGTEPAGFTRP